MRDIPKHKLEQYTSRRLLGIVEVDRSEPDPALQLSRDTLERIHDIAAHRYYVQDDAVACGVLARVARRLG